MLNEIEYNTYIERFNPTILTLEYLSSARSSEASRMAGAHAKSSITSFAISKKMGWSISLESRGPEKSFFILCEYDERILEVWDQPPQIKIKKTTKKGKKSSWYTPDFLILTKEGPCIVEAKSIDNAKELVRKNPDDWVEESGCFRYLPAEQEFAAMGLKYKVYIHDSKQMFKVSNLEILMLSRGESEQASNTSGLEIAFNEAFFWTLDELRAHLGLSSYCELYRLIDKELLYGDLENQLITNPESFVVVQNPSLLNEALGLINAAKLKNPRDLSPVPQHMIPTEQDATKALAKLERINSGEVSRSVRRWKAQIEQGKNEMLSPFQALLPKTYRSGNNQPKVPEKVRDFAFSFLKKKFASKQKPSISSAYIMYRIMAREAHICFDPVSLVTFRSYLKKLPSSVIAFNRGGKRPANAQAEPTDPLKRHLKPAAPFHSVSIDHYLADIWLIFFSDEGVVQVKRPWVSAMIDIYSNRVLAFSVSFESPSRRSISRLIRDCVKKHGKLPQEMMVDRGADFRSVYFASLLAHYGVTLSFRPASHPRYGSEVERFFGEFKSEWLNQREGNCTEYTEARSTDSAFKPKNSAVLRPEDFYRELEIYLGWRDHKPKSSQRRSAIDIFSKGQEDFPFFGIPVEYDDQFLISSAIESTNYSIDLRRGIHIGDYHYWSPQLSKLRGIKSHTEVRLDPENPHIIYAKVRNEWVVCSNSLASNFSTKNPFSQKSEIMIVRESRNDRLNLSLQAREELASKVLEMDELVESNHVPFMEISLPEKLEGDINIDAQLIISDVKTLAVEEW